MRQEIYERLLAINRNPQNYMDVPEMPEQERQRPSIVASLYRGTEQIALMPTPWRGEPFFHRHDDIEISYLLSGQVQMDVEDRSFQMKPGDFLVLDTNCVHRPRVENAETLLIGINVKPQFFDDVFFHRFYRNDPITTFFAKAIYSGKSTRRYLYFEAPDRGAFRDSVERMLEEYYEPQICSQELIESYMMIFFGEMVRAHAMRPEHTVVKELGDQLPQLGNIIGYMNAHLDTVTRQDIAQQFGYSYSYITKIIKETTGSGFVELRRRLRLQHAEKLLMTTDFPILQVAELSGFSGTSDFYRLFRQEFAMTPQEYRQQHPRNTK